ncbi:Arm DNA-binding domain-containing protein [Brevibacillus brevis]|uniref:tyrosine-type recombinase/integrase n=1 Tax=Brevibacillus brevis TaxID=1393 RepID=UPI000B152D9F|nr:Arm DNA-binding domain-containing protein [Brevibacillus brevis]WGV60394.1 Arm DNA-binding domain-containing protein [Brevibacillus brevis]
MASFQKYTTKDGVRWMYKYYSTIDPETGKKKPSTKRGFKTKKEAQLDAARTEQQLAEGTFITEDKSSVTFEQVFKQWFETISNTYKPAVLSKFNRRILPHFRKLNMKDISRAYCQDVINKVAEEIKSVENMKMYANQIFEYAISKEILVNNPLKGVIIPKKDEEFIVSADEPERNYWEKIEIKKFFDIAKHECTMRDFIMFHLLIYTGGRKGEVLALRWSDIDFKAKTIHFNKTLFYEKGKYVSLTSKTAASRRFISMDDTTGQGYSKNTVQGNLELPLYISIQKIMKWFLLVKMGPRYDSHIQMTN